jgi:hypothetical protein
MVGLIDASDLNKPLARMAWLLPMVELERAILDAVRDLKFTEEQQSKALENQATATKRRPEKSSAARLGNAPP